MGADRSVPTQYHYNSTTGKAEASGSAYSGGDGDFVTSGSLTLNDGDHITDSGGDNRITFTNAGSLILKDEVGNAGLTVDASQNVNLENGKILSVDTINEKTSAGGVTVDGVVLKDGGATVDATGIAGGTGIVPFVIDSEIETIAAGNPGAISVATYCTIVSTDSDDDAFTLANGTQKGQLKKIIFKTDGGGDAVVTITTPSDASHNVITMANAGEFAELMWNGSLWRVIALEGCTVA